MNILVDTSVWSLALRRKRVAVGSVEFELSALIDEGRVIMLGPIRQELLSGLKEQQMFEKLREHLRAFPDLTLESADYEEAAANFNRCRGQGVQGSNTDFLICAVAMIRDLPIFTTDGDFRSYARFLPIHLHEIRA